MNKRWVLSSGSEHCPSCLAASGQVHPLKTWNTAGIIPGSSKLYCGGLCNCHLEDTEDPESGDINAIPHTKPPEHKSMQEQTERVQLTSQVTDKGFQIYAITQGKGNGWLFSAEVLRRSVHLWNDVESFIDHSLANRRIQDLAGVCRNSQWDESAQGIRVDLVPFGPGAETLITLGKEILSNKTSKRIGFSADLIFTAQDKNVTEIIKVNSVDLVYSPARGGEFIRALNSKQGVEQMEDEIKTPEVKDPAPDNAQALRLQMCEYVLDSGLTASKLPEPVQIRVRAQFAGKEFKPAELTTAIEDARKLVTELTGPQTVQGVRLSGMANSDDQLRAAVSDMFGVERDAGLEKVQPARMSGIRELYHLLTGDYEMTGGYDRRRVTLATTSDFTGLVKNALNKIVVNRWQELGRAGYNWWEKIVTVEHFNSLNDITGTLVGTVGSLPEVAEGAEYTELLIGDSPETATWKKHGGYIPLTLELIDRDETRKLAAYPRELANAALRLISGKIAAIFTVNNNVGPTLADTGALFNATAVTTKGGHCNLLTAALAADKWDLVCAAMFNQPMLIKNETGLYGTGSKMGVDPKYLLVPRALKLTAHKIIYPSLENAANITSENQQQGEPGDVIVVPEWTSATNFAAVADPHIAPAIYIGERFGLVPEIFIAGDNLSPAVFTNDEHRLKVRHFSAVWVNDYRPLHKTNV